MMDNGEYHRCVICGERKAENEGIRIVMGFICGNCEKEMVHTDVKDAKYLFFVHQMKQLFVEKNA